jgi:hypothetical protein
MVCGRQSCHGHDRRGRARGMGRSAGARRNWAGGAGKTGNTGTPGGAGVPGQEGLPLADGGGMGARCNGSDFCVARIVPPRIGPPITFTKGVPVDHGGLCVKLAGAMQSMLGPGGPPQRLCAKLAGAMQSIKSFDHMALWPRPFIAPLPPAPTKRHAATARLPKSTVTPLTNATLTCLPPGCYHPPHFSVPGANTSPRANGGLLTAFVSTNP